MAQSLLHHFMMKLIVLVVITTLLAANSVLAEAKAAAQVASEPIETSESPSGAKPVNQVQKVLDLLNTKSTDADFAASSAKPDEKVGEIVPRFHASSDDALPDDAKSAGVR